MEILSPSYYFSSANWLQEENSNRTSTTKWSPQENKIFENALALYDKETPDRWQRVADLIPGKTVADVMRQYKELEDDVSSIEAGLWSVPGYGTPGFTLDWGTNNNNSNSNTHNYGFEDFKNSSYFPGGGKRSLSSSSSRPPEQERKKGIPWTEEEHKLFLMGLKKYGKGDWRNIARNFVITRTPTQVASHAQKYFIRQLSGGGKDKRRASIHDITTVHLNDHHHQNNPSPDGKILSSSSSSPTDEAALHPQHHQDLIQWNQHPNNNGARTMSFNSSSTSMMLSTDPFGQNLPQNMVFRMQSMHHHYSRG